MTTSFTTTEEFGTQMGEDFGGEPEYPVAFGITFTPQVTGIVIGVGGFLIAAYLLWSQVLPIWGELSQLRKDKADKENQLNQLSTTQLQLKIEQKQDELAEAKQISQDIQKLYASNESIETLLLDVSKRAELHSLRLNSYTPSADKQEVTDDTFGELAINNITVQTYNLDIEGTFAQVKLFLQDIERLQPLLIIKNFDASSGAQDYLLEKNQLLAVGEPMLKASVTINAIFPDL